MLSDTVFPDHFHGEHFGIVPAGPGDLVLGLVTQLEHPHLGSHESLLVDGHPTSAPLAQDPGKLPFFGRPLVGELPPKAPTPSSIFQTIFFEILLVFEREIVGPGFAFCLVTDRLGELAIESMFDRGFKRSAQEQVSRKIGTAIPGEGFNAGRDLVMKIPCGIEHCGIETDVVGYPIAAVDYRPRCQFQGAGVIELQIRRINAHQKNFCASSVVVVALDSNGKVSGEFRFEIQGNQGVHNRLSLENLLHLGDVSVAIALARLSLLEQGRVNIVVPHFLVFAREREPGVRQGLLVGCQATVDR